MAWWEQHVSKKYAVPILKYMGLVPTPSAKAVRLRSHFLDFTSAEFHYWVLNLTMDERKPDWMKWMANQWYEVYTRFYKA